MNAADDGNHGFRDDATLNLYEGMKRRFELARARLQAGEGAAATTVERDLIAIERRGLEAGWRLVQASFGLVVES